MPHKNLGTRLDVADQCGMAFAVGWRQNKAQGRTIQVSGAVGGARPGCRPGSWEGDMKEAITRAIECVHNIVATIERANTVSEQTRCGGLASGRPAVARGIVASPRKEHHLNQNRPN